VRKEIRVPEAFARVGFTNPLRSSEPRLVLPFSDLRLTCLLFFSVGCCIDPFLFLVALRDVMMHV
jgi:hypothetical protein